MEKEQLEPFSEEKAETIMADESMAEEKEMSEERERKYSIEKLRERSHYLRERIAQEEIRRGDFVKIISHIPTSDYKFIGFTGMALVVEDEDEYVDEEKIKVFHK